MRHAPSLVDLAVRARFSHPRARVGVCAMDADDPLERLHDACASGDLAAARAASDADLNAVDAEGQSALHHACAGGHLDVVLHVLDRAAPGACNLRDANDMTPFHLACEGGHLEVVRRLAAHPGLDRNLRATRRTSYFLASRHDHAEVCRLLEQLEREDGPEEDHDVDQKDDAHHRFGPRGGSFAVRAGTAEEDDSGKCNVS